MERLSGDGETLGKLLQGGISPARGLEAGEWLPVISDTYWKGPWPM